MNLSDRMTVAPLIKEWTDNSYSGDESIPTDSVLHGSMQIGSTMFHVQAMRVLTDEDGIQTPVDSMWDEDIEHVLALCGEGPLDTMEIDGHDGEYVVVIYPFAT